MKAGVIEGIKDTFRHFWLVFRCSAIGVFGLDIVPVLVGIFAIPEIVDLAVRGTSASCRARGAESHSGWHTRTRCKAPKAPRSARASAKGTFAVCWVPGAANNSKEGGELIPTVAFGVPGSGAMAILLGGFLIMGIMPGPDMLTKHLAITFSMVWTLVIANIITVLLCLLVLDQLAKVTYVRGGLIIPFVLMLNWREGNPECKQEPEEYFKKLYYDTAGPIRTAFVKLVYDTVGAGQILFGSDYPHGRGGRDDQFYPMTLDAMNDLDVPKADKEKIYYLNAKKLFGFTEE